ncbi:MAG: DMT family transporter [Gammaproteobacteria bacterium]|nr:DMT family transporter [Gammaproteobacteria bacterium]
MSLARSNVAASTRALVIAHPCTTDVTTESATPTRRNRPVAASLYMLAACACFGLNSVFVRLAAEDVHPFEVALFRNLFAIVFILMIVLPQDGLSVFRARRFDMLSARGALNSASMLAWFYAVPLLPLADLTALGFTAPLWATVLAALVLGETVRARRWTATIVGFLGTLVIVQPGFKEIHWAVYLVLFSSATWGATVILVRYMTGYERANTILLYQAIMMTVVALIPALFVWQTPTPISLLWMLILGALAATAHWCHVRAYSMQEVAALQPIDFSRLPIIALAAWLVFDEVATLWVWVGAAIVFTAGLYISHREAQIRRAELSRGK